MLAEVLGAPPREQVEGVVAGGAGPESPDGGEGTTAGGPSLSAAASAFTNISGRRVPIHVIAIAPVTNARVTLLHVMQPLQNTQARGGGAVDPIEWHLQKQNSEKYLDQIVSQLNQSGILGVDRVILEGGPANSVVDFARNNNVDLIVLSTHGQSGLSGWNVVEHLKRVSPETEFVISTGHGNMEEAIQAIRRGAWDFLPKPWQLFEIANVLQRLGEKRARVERLVAQPGGDVLARGARALAEEGPEPLARLGSSPPVLAHVAQNVGQLQGDAQATTNLLQQGDIFCRGYSGRVAVHVERTKDVIPHA